MAKPPAGRRFRRKTITHNVTVSVDARRIRIDPCCIHANRGDHILWHVDGRRPYSVIVKAWAGPLNWDYFVLGRGKTSIEAVVAPDAKPGFYPYAMVTVGDTGNLLVKDPEIIVPPPKGGRG